MIDYTGRRTLLLREGCQEGRGEVIRLGRGGKKIPTKRKGKGAPLTEEELQRLATTVRRSCAWLLYTGIVSRELGRPRALSDQLGDSKAGQTRERGGAKGEGAKGGKLCIARSRRHERRGGGGIEMENAKRKGIYFDTPFWFLLVYSASILNETLNLIPFAGTGVQDAARTCIYIVYIYSLSG